MMRAMLFFLMAWIRPGFADEPPVDQDALNAWWQGAGNIWMGKDAYQAEGTTFDAGACRYSFDEGVLIPLFSGQKPVGIRRIGLVFIGQGTMEVDFPDRADAWSFANHMVLKAGKDPAEMAAVANQEAPYRVPIENGFIVSADPAVQRVLFDLDPIGSGVMIKEGEEGIDEMYVVTEGRGKARAKAIATNLFPNRRRILQLMGLDPQAMLRQDRFLHEVFGTPAEEMRMIAEFRTEDHYRVAQPIGGNLARGEHDRWLSCYRDPQGFYDSGYETLVFSHGQDSDGGLHFRRFSGERLQPGEDGRMASPHWAPVYAETEIVAKPRGFGGNEIDAMVESKLTFRALGQHRQALTLSLPNWASIPDTYELTALETEDGDPIAYASLYALLTQGAGETPIVSNALDISDDGTAQIADSEDATSTTTSSDSASLSAGTDLSADTVDFDSLDSFGDQPTSAATLQLNNEYTRRNRLEIAAVLPKLVAPGEETTVVMRWKVRWPFSTMVSRDSSEGSTAVRNLGPTTGAQYFVPEILPRTGIGHWETATTVGVPGMGLRNYDVAVTGDTMREWQTEDGWKWVRAESDGARKPAVAVGRWQDFYDPRAMGLPAVAVHLFGKDAWALESFPPEVRRVLFFLEKFLPDYPFDEVDIFQAPTGIGGASSYVSSNSTDLVAMQTFMKASVGTSEGERENDYIAQTILASQLTSQYWGEAILPASARDRWVTEGLSDAYGMYYVRAALEEDGFNAFYGRLDALKKNIEGIWERRREAGDRFDVKYLPLSMSGSVASDVSGKLLADYRLYFWAHMLRKRIGDGPFFATIDQLAKDRMYGWVTSEDVKRAFEEASGQDLTAFFDQWVHMGLIPELRGFVRVKQGSDGPVLQGCVKSDQPFGHVELPVRVVLPGDDKQVLEALVDVKNGWGSFEIPGVGEGSEVELDPEGYILTYGRKVQMDAWDEGCPTTES